VDDDMDEYELRKQINDYIKEICHFSQMQVFATSGYQKNYFQLQIDEKTNGLIDFLLQYANRSVWLDDLYIQQQEENTGARVFTVEELAEFNGANGKPAYVATNGTVYDVTNIGPWAGGTHFGMVAGKDLSMQFMGCHQGIVQILEKVPKVGTLKA
jgi:predicted heme/steroid binding protein